MLNQLIVKYPAFNILLQVMVVLFGGVCFAIALNVFFIPGDIYSGGIAGVSQLITYCLSHFTSMTHVISAGNLYFILNIPLIILSLCLLGRQFTLLTLAVVATSAFMTNIIPVAGVSQEPMLNAIVGGVFNGVGSGVIMKFGMSGGGMDIIAMALNRSKGWNVGSLSLMMNSIIIVLTGFIYTWEHALFTIIGIYVASKMIDTIHTNEQRLTVFVVTSKVDETVTSVLNRVNRGITILDGKGGYSRQSRSVLMIVVNRYELYDLQLAITEVDPNAFIDIIQSVKISGNFISRQQQEKLRKQAQMQAE